MSSGSKYRKAIESVRQGLGKQRFLLAAASAAAAMWAPGAFAQVGTTTQIGIDMTTGRGENNTLGATEEAGAPGYRQTNWNNITTSGGGNFSSLNQTFSTVNPTTGVTSSVTLSMWWGTPNTWSLSTNAPSSADGRLMNGYIDSNNSGTGANDLTQAAAQPYIAITGLTGEFLNGYKVIVYADGDATAGRTAQYWLTTFNSGNPANVAGESELTPRVFLKDSANFNGQPTGYQQVPLTSNTGAGATSGNYIVFDGINSPNFVLRGEEFLIDTPRAPINAIQIVAAPILPTVDTEWALTGGGQWQAAGDWTNGIPQDNSYSANFLKNATGPAAVSLNSAITLKKMRFDNSNSYTISGGGSITINPNSGLGSVTVVSGSHSILVPLIAATTTTFDVAANSSLTLQNLSAGVNLVNKEGAGTMVLNSAGVFGAFAVNNGLLRLGGANVLGGGAVNGNTTGTIDLNGFDTNIKRLEGSPNITNSKSNTVNLNVRAETGALNVYGGVLSGPINVNLTGGGNVGFSGNNTYTGVTTISGYTMLRTQSNTALGSTNAGTVLDNGWLSLWNSDIGFEPITITPTSDLIEFQDRGTIRGPITYASGPGVSLTVDANSGAAGSAISLLGNITGQIEITKLGNNGLILGGHNTFPSLLVNQGWIGVAGDSDATTSPVGLGGLRLYDVGLRSIGGNHTINNAINIIADSATGMTVDPDPAGGTNVGVLTLTGTIDLQDHDTSAQQARRITTNADINFAGKVTGGGIIKAGNGTLILSNAANDFNGGLQILGGKVSVSQSANLGGTTQGILFQGGMLQVTGTTMTNIDSRQGQINWSSFSGGFDIATAANTFTVSQAIGGPNDTGFFRKDGLGTLVLTGSNQWSGGTTVNGGTLKIGTAASLPDNSAMTINGGLLDLNGNGKTFTSLNGTGGAIGNSSSAGMGVTVNGGGTWGGGIQNGPGTGTTSFTKSGNAALVLTGNSTYTGPTTLSGGTLQVDGSLGNTAVSVASGTTLTGKGSIGGVVTVNSGGTIAPLPTQLTVGGLTLNSGSKLNFLLGDGAGSSLIQVLNSGGLTLNGGAISLAQGAGFLGSSYDLIRYNGAFTGNFSNLSLATPTIGDTTFTLVNNPGAISIVVGTSLYTWTGANNGNWDTATANWKGAGTQFTAGGSARFDDTGATQAVNVTAPLTVGRLDVVNDTKDYTFSGSSIGGTGGLNKRGAAKATFTQPLTLTGPTVISSGAVQLDGAATLSSTSGINLGNSGPNPLDTTIPLAHGGTLFANGDNVNRLGTVPVSLNGGSLVVAKGATAGAGSASVGAITSSSAMSRVVVAPNGGNFTLTSPSLTHAATSNGTVDFRAATGTLGDAAGGQIKFTTAPATSNGLIGGWATVGDNFASYDPTNGVIGNVTSTSTTLVDGAVNVRDTSGANMTGAGSLTVNSLVNSGDVIMPVGSTLTITSGAAMMSGPNKWWQTTGGGNTNIIRAGSGVSKMFFTVIDRGGDHRLKMVVADNGTPLTFIKNGEGFLALDAANTHTGGTVVNAGTLALYNGASLGGTSSAATVMPGGTLDIRGQNLGTRAITISGSGDQGIGALINNGGSQQNAVINLNLAADASVGGTGRWDVRGTGANINGGTFTLTKVGGNQVSVVAPTSVSLGNINVNAGTLSFENGNNIMGSTSFAATVNVGGTLQFWNNLGGVTQNKPIVLNGGIVTSENNATTLTGPISLAGPATGELRANNALTITNVISGSGGFTKSGGDVLVLSNNNTYTGPTIVSSGTLRVTGSIAKSAVTVNGGTFEVPAVQKVAGLTVNAGGLTNVNNTATPYALTVGDGTSAASPFGVPASGTNFGKVQLNNNGMIVDVAAGGEAAAATSVRQAVLAAYNGGAWTGNGLTSAQITGANGLALGFGTPTEVAAAVTGGQFLGSPADASSIVVKATIAGDANLDKSVNFGDLLVLAKNYNTPSGSYWAKGDFNYDGAVNFGDLLILAKHYNQAMPTEPIPGASAAFEADMAAAFAAVPEPGTLSLLGIGAAAMLGRRQRRVRKS